MIIHVLNKNTLIIDDFILRCCIGKKGLNSNKKEGDYSTPKGFFNLKSSIIRVFLFFTWIIISFTKYDYTKHFY